MLARLKLTLKRPIDDLRLGWQPKIVNRHSSYFLYDPVRKCVRIKYLLQCEVKKIQV